MIDYTKIEPTGPTGEPARLAHGQFFGRFGQECEADGFSVALVRADPRCQVQWHTHATAHFIGVLSGPYVSSAAGAEAARAPVLVFNPAGTRHRDHFSGNPGQIHGCFLSVSVSDARLASLAEYQSLVDRATVVDGGQARRLTRRLAEELADWEHGSTPVVESLCVELVGAVARCPETPRGNPPSWLRTAEAFLREEGLRHTSIADLARLCGVHPVHLARVFRRYRACSPGTFARRCRADRAADLLARGDVHLSEVAQAAGYGDQSHLTREFKRHHGITPSEYRARFRR